MDPVAPAPTAHPHPISHPPPSRGPQSALQLVEGPLRSALGTLGGLLSGLPDLRIPLSSTPTASSWLLNTYLGGWVGGWGALRPGLGGAGAFHAGNAPHTGSAGADGPPWLAQARGNGA